MSEPLVTLDRFAQLRPDAPGFDAGSATGVAAARAALASASDEVEKHLRRSLLARAADLRRRDVDARSGWPVRRAPQGVAIRPVDRSGAAGRLPLRPGQARAVQLVRAQAPAIRGRGQTRRRPSAATGAQAKTWRAFGGLRRPPSPPTKLPSASLSRSSARSPSPICTKEAAPLLGRRRSRWGRA